MRIIGNIVFTLALLFCDNYSVSLFDTLLVGHLIVTNVLSGKADTM